MLKLTVCLRKITISSLNGQLLPDKLIIFDREAVIICLIQYFEADFLWKVSLKILNSGLILKTFTHDTIMLRSRGGTGAPDPPPSPCNGKSCHHWPASKMAFLWWAKGGPLRILAQTPSPFCKI